MLAHQQLELDDELVVAPERKLRVDPILDGCDFLRLARARVNRRR
jgi:hypothetical protein